MGNLKIIIVCCKFKKPNVDTGSEIQIQIRIVSWLKRLLIISKPEDSETETYSGLNTMITNYLSFSFWILTSEFI